MNKISKKTLIASICAVMVSLLLLVVGIFAWYWDGIPWARGAKVTTSPKEPEYTGESIMVSDLYPELPIGLRTIPVTYTVTNTATIEQTFVVKIGTTLVDGGIHPNDEGRSILDDITYTTEGLNTDAISALLKDANQSNYYITVAPGETLDFTITYVFEDRQREDKQNYTQGDNVVVSVAVKLQNEN